ncbi:MAG: hypothetical protein Q7S54_00120 [bacterium]|nr:hypothetical protein [bacterium]
MRCTMHVASPHSDRRPTGYWAAPAAAMAESFMEMMDSANVRVPVDARHDMYEFFAEVERAVLDQTGFYNETYRLAMRVFGFHYDRPTLDNSDELEDRIEQELFNLAGRYQAVMMEGQTLFSDEELDELACLIDFLKRLAALEFAEWSEGTGSRGLKLH